MVVNLSGREVSKLELSVDGDSQDLFYSSIRTIRWPELSTATLQMARMDGVRSRFVAGNPAAFDGRGVFPWLRREIRA